MRAAVQPSQECELALLHELRRNVNVLLAAPLKSDVADVLRAIIDGKMDAFSKSRVKNIIPTACVLIAFVSGAKDSGNEAASKKRNAKDQEGEKK